MPKGTNWTLTSKRKHKLMEMLQQQYAITSIAAHFGISKNTLHNHIREEGINAKEVRRIGVDSMRSLAYNSTFNIEEPAKRANAALNFLTKYDKIMTEPVTGDDDEDADADNEQTLILDAALDLSIRTQIYFELALDETDEMGEEISSKARELTEKIKDSGHHLSITTSLSQR